MPPLFDSASPILRNVDEVLLDPVQEALIDEVSRVLAPRIELELPVVRALWVDGVRAWQVEHGQTTLGLNRLLPSQRRAAALEITAHFVRFVNALRPEASLRVGLEKMLFTEGLRLYMDKYNRRPRLGSSR